MPAAGVKALFFDVFGTLVDWRSGVAGSAQATLKPLGIALDWLAAWPDVQAGLSRLRRRYLIASIVLALRGVRRLRGTP
jgi:2-haloacid dehalogenase